MTCGIYLIKNMITSDMYIGRSCNIERRWNEHRHDYMYDNKLLYNAMRKYGMENFNFSILEECSLEDTFEKEMYYIKKYDTYRNGYNQTLGGEDGAISTLIDDIDDIIKDLQNEDIFMKDIAEKYDVTLALISMVNSGKRCFQSGVEYPIRKHKGREITRCIDCGKEISRGCIRCMDCFKRHNRSLIPNKEELIDSVINSSFEETGRKYNVDGNTIKNWLKDYGEPYKKKELYEKYSPNKLLKKDRNYIYKAGYDDDKKVIMKSKDLTREFKNVVECAEYLKANLSTDIENIKSSIRRVLRGKRNSYLGYFFEYVD